MTLYSLILTVIVGIAYAYLTVFSYLDYKYREVPDQYVWSFIGSSICSLIIILYMHIVILNKAILIEALYIVISVIAGPLVSYILYRLDLFGEADVYMILGLSIAFYNDAIYTIVPLKYNVIAHLPPIIPILFYANLLMALYIPLNGVKNMVLHKSLLPPRDIGIIKWLIIVFTGKPARIRDYLSKKHVFPLTIYNVLKENDKTVAKVRYRTTFQIKEDYTSAQESIKQLLQMGLINENDYIWITYGIPFIVLLLVGFTITLIIGDSPLLMLLHTLR